MSIWKKFRGLNDREITYDANSIRGERTMTMADYMMTAILLAATLAAITFFGPAVAAIFTGLGVASGGAALVSTIAIGTVGLLAASQAPRINNGLAGLKEAYNDRTAQNNIKNQIKEDLIKVQNAEKKAQKGAHKENLTDQTILREIQKLGKSKKFNTETINQLKDLTGKLEFKNFDKLNQKDIEQTFKLIDGIPNELIKETVKNQLKTEIRKFDINTQQDLLERTPTKIKDQFSPMIGSTENYKKEFKEKAANMSKNGQTFEQAFKDEL
ncbi:MAG: hypothetical protein ISQ32_05930, partial [Rickettsiales bacterium]|nr:hypothetical protein [Rickettsiales bacterium]